MSDKSDPPKGGGGIPAWQRTDGASDSSTASPSAQPAADQSTSTTSSSASSDDVDLAKAEIFLQDESIRGASTEQKVSFLESRGLGRAIIDKALESTSSTPSSQPATPPTTVALQPASTASAPPPVPSRDVPPIITYPEFLMHAQKPPPIITFQRLLNTAYIALGAAAAVYGTSKYLVKPMSESLNSARHDFASHTQEKLDELNEKLKEVVSSDPKDHARPYTDATSEADTSDSDPTELFHRDFGTQTSPELDETSDSSSDDARADRDPIRIEQLRLDRLRQICKDIASEEDSERDTAADTSTVIRVLNEQLDSMTYSKQSWTNGVFGATAAPGSIGSRKDEDEAARMRNEIRAMKGVLLAARNFPTSQPQTQARPVRPAAHGSTAA